MKLGDSPALSVVRKLNRKLKKRSSESKSLEDLGIDSVICCEMGLLIACRSHGWSAHKEH